MTLLDEKYYLSIAETLDAMPERVIRYMKRDLTITYCNAAWAAGHGRTPAEVIGRRLATLLSPPERAGLKAQLARLGPDNPHIADDVARPAPNSPGQWVEWVDQYLTDHDGGEVLAIGRDVTGRHIAELNLAASETRFRELADNSADVVWRFIATPVPHFDYISPSIENILGYPASLFLDDFAQFLKILDDDGRALIAGGLRGETMPERHDFRYRCADGSIVIGEMQTTKIRHGLQGVSRDVTELRTLQATLSALALRDTLTGLANRRLLNELLAAAIKRTEHADVPLAVAFLDLDGFKAVNDTHGHDAGDIVLCETARRLLTVARSGDVVARLGGDEFVIVFEPMDPGSDTLLHRIEQALSQPITVSAALDVRCPASVGHADTRSFGRDASRLMAAADAAMYDVKRSREQREAGAHVAAEPTESAASRLLEEAE